MVHQVLERIERETDDDDGPRCEHIEAIETVKHPKIRQCDACVKIGAEWVHLRTCQECGTTLCCDDSPTGTPRNTPTRPGTRVIASAEPGERWLYCYPDDAMGEY